MAKAKITPMMNTAQMEENMGTMKTTKASKKAAAKKAAKKSKRK